MYPSVELWVEAIFFNIYINKCSLLYPSVTFWLFSSFLSWMMTFYIFYTLKYFSVEVKQFTQQYPGSLFPTFTFQDSKARHGRFNAKSTQYEQVPTTSVFTAALVLALSEQGSRWGPSARPPSAVFLQTSELCLFLCNTKTVWDCLSL